MGGLLSRNSSKLSTADERHLARKCNTVATAYSKCHKANPNEPRACNNLQTSLVMCYAADLCKEASEAHQKCYMSVINTGYYQVGCQLVPCSSRGVCEDQKLLPSAGVCSFTTGTLRSPCFALQARRAPVRA
eukprot:GHRQ01020180.1.p1 GENE.GHRQ01020180.1~~GHRQ01020180.1.p1  ORF type:complete len:132 (+),score=5.21 GHRQ01020180.1:390-785(+)